MSAMTVSKWFSRRLGPSFSTWQWGLVSSIACQKSGEAGDGDVQKSGSFFSSYLLFSTSSTFPGKTPPALQIKSLLQTSLRLTIFTHTTLPLPLKWLAKKQHSTRFVSCKRCNYRYQQSAHLDKSAWKALTSIWIPRPGSPESPIWFVLINDQNTRRNTLFGASICFWALVLM